MLEFVLRFVHVSTAVLLLASSFYGFVTTHPSYIITSIYTLALANLIFFIEIFSPTFLLNNAYFLFTLPGRAILYQVAGAIALQPDFRFRHGRFPAAGPGWGVSGIGIAIVSIGLALSIFDILLRLFHVHHWVENRIILVSDDGEIEGAEDEFPPLAGEITPATDRPHAS